jgi:hypothetical protein
MMPSFFVSRDSLLIYPLVATYPAVVAYMVEAKCRILLRWEHGLARSNDDYNPDAAVTKAKKKLLGTNLTFC